MRVIIYLDCSECKRRNYRKTSGVIIDRCNRHGTWLDADELEQITGFVLSGGNPVATAIFEEADRSARKTLAGAEFSRIVGKMSSESSMRTTRPNGSVLRTIAGVLGSLLE